MEEQSARKTILVLLSIMLFFFCAFLVTSWLMFKLTFPDGIGHRFDSGDESRAMFRSVAERHLESHAVREG
jgi:hypothetical protein